MSQNQHRRLTVLSTVKRRGFDRPDLIKIGYDADALIVGERNRRRHRFFPHLIRLMGLRSGVEVGVNKGWFSLILLQEPTLQKLYCIDNWEDDYLEQSSGDLRFQEATLYLKTSYDSGRTVIIRKTSAEAAQDFKNGSIDFCYIDGDHTYEGVYINLRVWLPKVRIGGIMSGHDYNIESIQDCTLNFRRDAYLTLRVKPAVDDFTLRYGFDLRSTGRKRGTWWFVKNREADDPDGSYLIDPPSK